MTAGSGAAVKLPLICNTYLQKISRIPLTTGPPSWNIDTASGGKLCKEKSNNGTGLAGEVACVIARPTDGPGKIHGTGNSGRINEERRFRCNLDIGRSVERFGLPERNGV
jgi:hypothetical protein